MDDKILSSDSEPRDGVSRRQVIGGSLMLLGIPPCCTTQEVPPASLTVTSDALFIDLKKAPGLQTVGVALAVVDAARKLDIIVVRVEKDRFAALDRSCTHNNAQCTYNPRHHTLQCTSLNHAEYDLQGLLLHGRTHGNLRTYEVRLEGDRLEVLLEKRA